MKSCHEVMLKEHQHMHQRRLNDALMREAINQHQQARTLYDLR